MNLDNSINYDMMKKALAEVLQQERPHYAGENIAFNDFMRDWLDAKATELAETTADKYEGIFRRHIEPAFRGLKLTDITTEGLQRFIKEKKACLSSGSVRELKIAILVPALDYARKKKLIEDNPAKDVKVPKLQENHKRALTNEEIDAMYKVSSKHYAGIAFIILLYSGIRRSELLALRWNDVYETEADPYIMIQQGLVSSETKGNILKDTKNESSKRPVAIPISLANLLADYRKTEGAGKTYVISQRKQDKPIDPHNFNRLFRTWCNKAGIKGISPHSMRHTYCTLSNEVGLDNYTIMKQVGHTTSRMLERVYIHTRTNEMQQRGANRIGSFLDNLLTA